MTRVFNENGQSIPVTVLKIETNIVSMIKNTDVHGYNAIQISSSEQKDTKVNKPHLGHFKKTIFPHKKILKNLESKIRQTLKLGKSMRLRILKKVLM